MREGNLLEIFSSYQGEGAHVGVRQVFVRLGICHMRCVYCDTPESWTASRSYRVERAPNSQAFDEFDNPASMDRVLEHVRALAGPRDHSISITGGEPLVQVEFLEELLPALKDATGLPIYLETSGTLSDKLARVAKHVDFFALDFKPPSTPGVSVDWEDFRRCVKIASAGDAQVKVVIMRDSPTEDEIERACEMIPGGVALVFTPVTPVNDSCPAPDGDRIRALRAAAERRGVTPLVIPQIHRLVGWL